MGGRIRFLSRAFRRGLPWLWSIIGLAVLVVGGSLLGYLALARERPYLALAILAAALALAVLEGAFRIHREDKRRTESAQRDLERFEQERPQLSFGRPEIPTRSRPYQLRIGSGSARQLFGRIIRVPVMNAPGSAPALGLHAQLISYPTTATGASRPSTQHKRNGMVTTSRPRSTCPEMACAAISMSQSS